MSLPVDAKPEPWESLQSWMDRLGKKHGVGIRAILPHRGVERSGNGGVRRTRDSAAPLGALPDRTPARLAGDLRA